MNNQFADLSQRQAIRYTGFAFLCLLLLAIFKMSATTILIVPDDVATTINNILSSEWLFRSSIVGSFFVYVMDIVSALLIYALVKPVNQGIALLAAWFRVVYY